MRYQFFRICISVFLVLAFTVPVFAEIAAVLSNTKSSPAEDKPFYKDKMRGWYWGEEEPIPEEEKKPEKEPITATSPMEGKTAKDFSYEELWKMYPPDFQQVYTNTMNTAIQSLNTEDNKSFMTVQDIARRKSLAFANVTAYTVQTNPQFNVIKDYPVAAPGRKARLQNQQEEKANIIRSARSGHALLYFYSITCKYCQQESGILDTFYKRYGWEIKGIDVNENIQLTRRFNVETTPTLYLIKDGNPQPFPVAIGVTPLTELENTILSGIRILAGGGPPSPTNYSMYEFQRGSTFDPEAELRRYQSQAQ